MSELFRIKLVSMNNDAPVHHVNFESRKSRKRR